MKIPPQIGGWGFGWGGDKKGRTLKGKLKWHLWILLAFSSGEKKFSH